MSVVKSEQEDEEMTNAAPQSVMQQQQQPKVFIQGQEPLTASMLAAASPKEQKQLLGMRLFPLISGMYPDVAGKITGMLLEIDNSELVHMLEHQESLKNKVEEAVTVLKAHEHEKQRQVQEKQMLGGRLFSLIFAMQPNLAGKIMDLLMVMDNSDLAHMLDHQESLKNKVEEAVAYLGQQQQHLERAKLKEEQTEEQFNQTLAEKDSQILDLQDKLDGLIQPRMNSARSREELEAIESQEGGLVVVTKQLKTIALLIMVIN